jgi:ZIP family zinc transporter
MTEARPRETVDAVTAALGGARWPRRRSSSVPCSGSSGPWPPRLVGLVLAFGAGALISAVSFDLAEEAARLGDPAVAGRRPRPRRAHLLRPRPPRRTAGAMRRGDDSGPRSRSAPFLDGIPEQTVLGIGLAAGEGVSVGLLVAIFVSNLPEAIGSSTAMRAAGPGRRRSVGSGCSSR